MKGRLDVVKFLKARLARSQSGVIERVLIMKWLDMAKAWDGKKRRA